METTFISIHDLSLDARLLYVSTSITDILGYTPEEVVGKSCWEYFHPDEIPFARSIHGRGVRLDKAAVLNYCQIKNRDGRWVGCECVFTCVHDVLVASTSIYRTGANSQKRAVDAPVVRQMFSSSPKDPRYHMLSYISHKFQQEVKPQAQQHEPRAALFLNRFTRTLTIVYATNGLANILGVTADELRGKSFYYCIQENCLKEAVKCLESAKANDSIAYLRFWFRDPRQDDRMQDEDMDGNISGEDEDGGVHLDERMDDTISEHAVISNSSASQAGSMRYQSSVERSSVEQDPHYLSPHHELLDPNSRTSSGNSSDLHSGASDMIFDQPPTRESSTSSLDASTSDDHHHFPAVSSRSPGPQQIELEAVVSCTSDGLVVVLRRAKALVPRVSSPSHQPVRRSYENGFFASPWATDSLLQNIERRRHDEPDDYQPGLAPLRPTVAQADTAAMRGPDQEDFMNSIREVVVFAWSLTGINGSLARYGRGKPTGESLPPDGLPIWKPDKHMITEQKRHPYHGNNPQETRQQDHDRQGTDPYPSPLANGLSLNSNSHDSDNSYYRSDHVLGNGNGNLSFHDQGLRHQFGEANESGYNEASYHNGASNGYSIQSNGAPYHNPNIGADFHGVDSSLSNEGLSNDEPRPYIPRYDNGDFMDTRNFDQYQDHGYGNQPSYDAKAATNSHDAPWPSQSQQTQHWDGLMPAPTTSQGNTQYYSSSSYHR